MSVVFKGSEYLIYKPSASSKGYLSSHHHPLHSYPSRFEFVFTVARKGNDMVNNFDIRHWTMRRVARNGHTILHATGL